MLLIELSAKRGEMGDAVAFKAQRCSRHDEDAATAHIIVKTAI